MTEADLATARARNLVILTERLTARLSAETAAFEARRPQDVAAGLTATQELANQYRRESALIKSNPIVLVDAPLKDRQALIQATQKFETVLSHHATVVEAARIVSEGLVRTIAGEVAASRAMGTGYGASGHAATGDNRAITYNRAI